MSSLNETIKEINKQYGDDSVQQISKLDNIEIERIPTGCSSLDYILGGGLPRGRVVEIFGPPSSGKTILSLFIIKEIQNRNGKAAFFDAENAFANEFAEAIGVKVKDLFYSQSVVAEDVLNMINSLVKTNEMDVIVLDSVASLVPRKELEGEIGDQTIALQARIMSQALRMLVGLASKTKTSLIFLNQVRDRVGIFWGSPETTSGGKALKFYSSIRLRASKGKNIEEKGEVVGNIIKIEVQKNKVAPPFRKAEIELIYKKGINVVSDTFDFALIRDVISKDGNTYSFNETKLGVGKEATKEYLEQHKDIFDAIVARLNEHK